MKSLKVTQLFQNLPGTAGLRWAAAGALVLATGYVHGQPNTPTIPAGPGAVDAQEKPQPKKELATAPVSEPANFVHDCLRPISPIKGAPTAKASGGQAPSAAEVDDFRLFVASQSADGTMLNVVPATKKWIGCEPVIGAELSTVSLSDVAASGALRSGFVYGVLVAPFKFYPHSGEIAGSATVGPYLGWRKEGFNSNITWVATAGISSVPGTASDIAQSKKTVPLTAISAAGGAIFEVSKGKSPFRIGLLAGKDWTDPKSSVKFDNNAKTWVAIQFGIDLADK